MGRPVSHWMRHRERSRAHACLTLDASQGRVTCEGLPVSHWMHHRDGSRAQACEQRRVMCAGLSHTGCVAMQLNSLSVTVSNDCTRTKRIDKTFSEKQVPLETQLRPQSVSRPAEGLTSFRGAHRLLPTRSLKNS